MTRRSRRARWQGALVVAAISALLGVAVGVSELFFLAVVALGFVLVGQLSAEPDANLRVERHLEETRVRPGKPVTVTLSVTNEGDRVVSDVRLADEPPADAPVTDGSPAFATAVRPEETVSHEYELTPPRGEFSFGPTRLRTRSLAATSVATDERDPDGDAELSCETLLDTFPVLDQTIQFVGRTPTDDGGSGIEFFSTREYRRGDPINRIDWHRFARTGELATVEYREERAVTVVFVVDDRDGVHREPLEGGPDSYDLTLYAASRGVVASLEDGNRTGVATLSGRTWIEPSAETDVRTRMDDELGDATADRPVTEGGSPGASLAADLERRLPRRAQVVLCTPLSDRGAVDLVETLRSRGRDVTVVTPDLTTGVASASIPTGARIAGLRRTNRIDALRGVGATVVDWHLEDPISVDLARAFRGSRSGRSSPARRSSGTGTAATPGADTADPDRSATSEPDGRQTVTGGASR
ncbi:DUF58 domain-containing protein [Natrialba swarupiae]|uniref:DUF58 domain-containing protein n=1 Tax=Natrialba swarupiae TaxID=2448032 RepID=A0A5D5AR83_9EURY|nr:DUF58 domain-containing protein [Natrialba swarupiae]TYT62332.1 DUF58 domain-containing protein [Natrialba swarupiae]